MAILNYTTQIDFHKSISEIQHLLATAKCEAILIEYDKGAPTNISFRIKGQFGLMTFMLPSKTQQVYQVISRDRSIPPRYKTIEQAQRIGWRILKDWLEAQLALIRMGMVDLEQVFLPYAQTSTGETLYSTLKSSGFSGLALPEPGNAK